jgi:RimJ/RimL family protein N-acetyltransferase
MLPTFETNRLSIRPRSATDLDDCLMMDRDPLVTRFIPGPWSDPERHRAFVLDRMNATYPAGMGYWSAVRRSDPEQFSGWVLLLPYRIDEVEIGWRFKRDSWGHGFATEAAAPILQYAIETLGLASITADIHPDNVASLRVAEKLGMSLNERRTVDDEPTLSYRFPGDRH